MKTYKTAMTILGLGRGDTFESDDPGWDKYVKGGFLTVVDGDEPAESTEPVEPVRLSREVFNSRVEAGDPTPVKPGEIYSMKVRGGKGKGTDGE